jgi:predicted ATPase with chaperone activity
LTARLFKSDTERRATLLTQTLTPEQIRRYDQILDTIGYQIKFVNSQTLNYISVNGRFFILGEMSTDDAINQFKISMRYHAKAIDDAVQRIINPEIVIDPEAMIQISTVVAEHITTIRGDSQATVARILALSQQNVENLEEKTNHLSPR